MYPFVLSCCMPSLTKMAGQQSILFEAAEADLFGHLERQVFLNSRMLDFSDEDALSPTSGWAQGLAWIFVALYAVSMAFYVCLFAVKAGREMAIQWMISFWIALIEVRALEKVLRFAGATVT